MRGRRGDGRRLRPSPPSSHTGQLGSGPPITERRRLTHRSSRSLPAVEVPPGVTTDVLGQPNAGVNYSMIYMPTQNASVALGQAMK